MLIANPNLTILIASETIGNAESILKEIKSKIESESFVAIFGTWKNSNEWRTDSISIKPRKHVTKEGSIETAGLGKALTGKHFDVILCDDIVGSEDRDSEAKRQKTFDFFNGLFDVLKKESGILHVTGTRWHRDDLYNHIEKKLAPELERKGLGTFEIHIKPAHDKDGLVNYPRLLPESRLQEMRTVKQGRDGVDISTYMAQYELNPLSSSEQIFKTYHTFDVATAEFTQFVQWTDPALSDKSTACYSAIVVMGKFKHTKGWGVVYASVDKRSPSQLMADHNRIYRLMRDQYKVESSVYMEDNGFQMLLRNNAIDESRAEGDEVPTIGRKNTENKLARIRSMEPYISQGFLTFRKDYETAPEGYRILLEELLSFPQSHMDAIDAMQGAYSQTQSRYMSDGDIV
jgi:predicted phage terminase large subunit-like protein